MMLEEWGIPKAGSHPGCAKGCLLWEHLAPRALPSIKTYVKFY
jgi:hypothetical protein